jgi:hypothetical protein
VPQRRRPGTLVHILDKNTGRRFLVDTGASFSIFPHRSPSRPSGPCLTGPGGQAIPCWGSQPMDLLFHGRRFCWTLLLADVQFPIIGVDFLRHFHLMVDPAANRLVDKRSSQELSTISSIASGVARVKAPPGSPATAGQAATCGQDSSQDKLLFVSAIPGPKRFRRIVAQFPQVVNLQKSLPAPTTGVEHHIVTRGPPVTARFRRLDAESFCSWRRRASSGVPPAPGHPRSTWSGNLTGPGGHAEIIAASTW